MNAQISVILLSGGRGQRFGERDKGLELWRGKPMLESVLNRLSTQSDQIILSCNRHIDRYRRYGLEICSDRELTFQGPLAGIAACYHKVSHPWCLVCPNDTPLIPEDLAHRLLIAAEHNRWQIAYPVTGDRHQYLPALIRSDILASSEQALANGVHSLHEWYAGLNAGTVDFSEQAESLININTPDLLV